jgi:hypothetical protein
MDMIRFTILDEAQWKIWMTGKFSTASAAATLPKTCTAAAGNDAISTITLPRE